jgi:N-acyl-D-amino-acid deacylase
VHDIVIKGGTVVDGTGAPARTADVAISGGLVTEVGKVDGAARQVVDADGALVTPGFVDVHTHYDGQITWDPLLTPSCWHGVTTVVMGNCGVGFAPAAPERREWLIGLMEGVEDIPGAALATGIRWAWESFPEYLDHVQGLAKALDVGCQVPHGAVRAYVMGERGARNEAATADDIDAMAAIVRDGLRAGALGFSTSRTIMHRAIDGEPVPGTYAAEDELFGIGAALRDLGTGVFELAPAGVLGEDLDAPEQEIDWICRLAAAIKRPVSFALLQNHRQPEAWRTLLALSAEAAAAGAPVRPQVHGRTVSILLGHQTFHPFSFAPSWSQVAALPRGEQLVRLQTDSQLRAQLIAELDGMPEDPVLSAFMSVHRIFPLGDPPDYEPGAAASVAGIAERERRTPAEVLFDLLFTDGRELLNSPVANYGDGTLEPVREMLGHPVTAFGLADGGAHASQTCDASTTTFLISHWARDRRAGERIPLELAVHKMTGATADLYGLGDRGRLAAGMAGDVNVIDLPRLQLRRPELVSDLPAGASRLIQRATGYVSTIKSGTVTFVEGEHTGAHPGRLLRGARSSPN